MHISDANDNHMFKQIFKASQITPKHGMVHIGNSLIDE